MMSFYIENKKFKYFKTQDLVNSICNRFIAKKVNELFDTMLEASGKEDYAVKMAYKQEETFYYLSSLEVITEKETLFSISMNLSSPLLEITVIDKKGNKFKSVITQDANDSKSFKYTFSDVFSFEVDYTEGDKKTPDYITIFDENVTMAEIYTDKDGKIKMCVIDGVNSSIISSYKPAHISIQEGEKEYVIEEVNQKLSILFNNDNDILKLKDGSGLAPTHFDMEGFPYKGKITDGHTNYLIHKSMDKFKTVAHPEGTYLISSVEIEDRIFQEEEVLIKDSKTETYYNQLKDILSVFKGTDLEIIYNLTNNNRYDISFDEKKTSIKYNGHIILEREVKEPFIVLYIDNEFTNHYNTIDEKIVFP